MSVAAPLRIAALAAGAVFILIVAIASAVSLTPVRAEAASSEVWTCGGGTIALNSAEKAMLARHNKARVARDKSRLCIHPKLQRAARGHARDMIQRDYFSHDTKGSGETFADRIEAEGYRYSTIAENIAYGTGSQGSPDSIFRSWMNSSGHRQNILNGSLKQVGIARASGEYGGSSNAHMWVADFGTP